MSLPAENRMEKAKQLEMEFINAEKLDIFTED